MEKQPDRGRGNWALLLAIGVGLLLGLFIKKVHIGLLLGLAIGLLASAFIRKK